MGKWTAEITNDPRRDYRLYVELLEDDKFRGRLERTDDGQLKVTFYEAVADLPWEWLAGIAQRWKDDDL
jgi:hypothetical protein